ncbi:MMPL family transporter [Cellulomonas aerilata]|uniref:Membrane protein n=1 Tax=Cellulomonas aerilata TaxID=515326 RepID=A0A512DB78_9CELL|nr:MMPL family transporter [Cellulomonas aerilata]GEO33744.1 membrane protein [Cellulomonas aerilata]
MLSISRSTWLRTLAVVVALGAWLSVAAVGGPAQGRLSQVQTNDAAAFLPASAESTRAARADRRFVTEESLPALVVLRPAGEGAVTPAQLSATRDVVAGLAALRLPGSDPAEGDPATVGDVLLADPVVVPSQDGRALLVPLSLDGVAAEEVLADDSGVVAAVVTAVRAGLDDALGATATSAGDAGLQAWVTGPAGFVADLVSAFGGIDVVLLLVALGAVLLILVVVYRSPFLPLVVILTPLFALTAAALVVYRLAAAGALTLNGQTQGILSILVVGAAVDYALLLVARYREELRHVRSTWTAMGRAVRATVAPIAASAGTVVAGLLCLTLSDLGSNKSLGPVAAIGIASAFLASLTFLPALLLVAGQRSRGLFWPNRPRYAPSGAGDDPVDATAVPTDVVLRGSWGRLARAIGRRPRAVWVTTAAVLAVGAAFLPTFEAGGTDEADVFLTDVDAVAGLDVLAEHFPAGAVQPAVVIVPEPDVAAVVDAAAAVDGVASAAPFTGTSAGGAPGGTTDAAPGGPAPGGATPGGPPGGAADGPPVVVDGTVRVEVVTQDAADTAAAVDTVAALRDAVHAVSPDALVGGAAAETLDTQLAGARDLRVIVPVVLLVIFVILMLLLRSVLAAVLLMAANVLSFAAALGVSALVFEHVLGFPGADPTVPLYGFVFLVALGVDYSIFLMTRVREEAGVWGTRPGVLRGLAATGGVITSAGVVLAATFAALAVIPLLFLAQLAFIVAFGVLVDTLVVRSLLVPALVHDVGRRVWWPSRWDPAGVGHHRGGAREATEAGAAARLG